MFPQGRAGCQRKGGAERKPWHCAGAISLRGWGFRPGGLDSWGQNMAIGWGEALAWILAGILGRARLGGSPGGLAYGLAGEGAWRVGLI